MTNRIIVIIGMLATLVFGCADISVLEPGVNIVPVDKIGTAFAIDEDTWITAVHVVDFQKHVTLATVDGDIKAAIVSVDRKKDIAVLMTSDFLVERPINICKADLDEHVAGAGYTGSEIDNVLILETEGGFITRLKDSDPGWPGIDLIQAFVGANPGWSGGPLINRDGCAVGMIVGGNTDYNYSHAIKITHLR